MGFYSRAVGGFKSLLEYQSHKLQHRIIFPVHHSGQVLLRVSVKQVKALKGP